VPSEQGRSCAELLTSEHEMHDEKILNFWISGGSHVRSKPLQEKGISWTRNAFGKRIR